MTECAVCELEPQETQRILKTMALPSAVGKVTISKT